MCKLYYKEKNYRRSTEKKEAEIRKKEDVMQEERLKRRNEMKLEMKKKNEYTGIIVSSNIQVKLTKLVITRFEGVHLDWFRFWNQFEI